jgi:hypothetical protein
MLYEGQIIRLHDGVARVERVTECSASICYINDPNGGDNKGKASGVKTTISPNSEVETVRRMRAEKVAVLPSGCAALPGSFDHDHAHKVRSSQQQKGKI